MYGEIKNKYYKFLEKYPDINITYNTYYVYYNTGMDDTQIFFRFSQNPKHKYFYYIKKYGEGYEEKYYNQLKNKGLSDTNIQERYLDYLYHKANNFLYNNYLEKFGLGFNKKKYLGMIYKGYSDEEINEEYSKKPKATEEGLNNADLYYIREMRYYDTSESHSRMI